MNKVIFKWILVLVLFSPNSIYSQISGKVVYKSVLESEAFNELESTLYFKGMESYFYVKMNPDELLNDAEDLKFIDDSKVQYEFDFTLKRPTRYEVYINRNTNGISTQSSIFKDGSTIPCVVLEETGTMNWQIESETKRISSFLVQKATIKFRGRSYEAWFAPEIPISIGPWKFHGLPGLILEIYDQELGVQFLFHSIEIPYETNEIIQEPSNGIKIPIAEYMDHNKRFGEEFLKLVKAKLPREVSITEVSMKRVNRSIEREYE